MGGGKEDPECHFIASFVAAIINFPLWRAAAIEQSGFKVQGSNILVRYYKAVMQPPHRGLAATIFGMSWARGFIFYGSDIGRNWMNKMGFNKSLCIAVPPALCGVFVQVANMPLVRGTITIQNPSSEIHTVRAALIDIYGKKGIAGLWHGTSAGILKTVPKYVTAVAVRDWCEDKLPPADPSDANGATKRSAIKSVAAGLAGAALTNPLDVIRNEMFKTDLGLMKTVKDLWRQEGAAFLTRGITSNMTAVGVPLTFTIFLTDILRGMKKARGD